MEWTARLNGELRRHSIGGGRVEFMQWSHMDHLPDNWPHRHTYYEACLVGSHGAGSFIVEDRVHRVKPGTLFVARPGVIHQIVNDPGPEMELYWVSFGWTQDDTSAEKSRLMKTFVSRETMVAEDDGTIIAAWTALRIAAENARLGNRERMIHLASSLILSIAIALVVDEELYEFSSRDHSVARLAVRYVEDNLVRPLTLEEIAQFANVSPRHLTRLFKEFTGESPIRYLLRARLDRARSMLVNSSLPIKVIAEQVGFLDDAYFSRCFKHAYGVPPATYRAQNGGGPIIQGIGALI